MLLLPASPITKEVVRQLNPSLVRYAQHLVSRKADADDLVQETWCSAMRSIHLYRGESSLLTWLRRIMVRRLADRLRKNRQMVELDEDMVEVHDVPTPFDLVSGARDAQALVDALQELTRMEREAVLLCDLQELERDEAAARLVVQRGHLRVLLHRARQKLTRALESTHERALSRVA